ncbi:MAG: AraC family transcriptional regulator [Phycisphaerae bacterium]|nr:AraC family transcriptional regulator [Phycisphaerae bacterium]
MTIGWSDLRPYLRVASNQRCRPGMHLHPRVIFDHYLACVAEGALLVNIAGKEQELQPGTFIFIEPGVEHEFRCYDNVPVRLPHLHFDFFTLPDAGSVFVSFKQAEELTAHRRLFRPPIHEQVPELRLDAVIQPLYYEAPLQCLMNIISLQGQSSPAAMLEQRGYVLQLIAMLLRACQGREVNQNPRHLRAMEDAMQLIRDEFQKPLSLDDLAEAVHLSPSHFGSLFRQYYQSSPMQFLRNYRIEQVKHLLLTTDRTLTQIAAECGFSSVHALSRAFKEVSGMSPSDFLQGRRTEPDVPAEGCPMSN